MRQIRFAVVDQDEGEFSKLLKLGADGFTHTLYTEVYPDEICIITDCRIADLNLNLEITLPDKLLEHFCYAEPQHCITLKNALHEVREDFEIPEIDIKFIYTK